MLWNWKLTILRRLITGIGSEIQLNSVMIELFENYKKTLDILGDRKCLNGVLSEPAG